MNNSYFLSIAGAIIMLAFSSLSAQSSISKKRFATQLVHNRLILENPEFSLQLSQMEEYLNTIQELDCPSSKLFIPIVFHIVHGKDEVIPDDEQINLQIKALNDAFNQATPQVRHKADTARVTNFSGKNANVKIKFSLTDTNPSGARSEGVNIVESKIESWGIDDAVKYAFQGGADAWFPGNCLNVWVTDLSDDISGYAQLPGGPLPTDGIVIDKRFFGVGGTAEYPHDMGKTLVHLVGTYLGLYELWNETSPCEDDNVDDTPIHNSPNYHFDSFKHVSLCKDPESDYQIEMTMNYMDCLVDSAMYMFTQGQMNRMRKLLYPGGPRHTLLTNNNFCSESKDMANNIDKALLFDNRFSNTNTSTKVETSQIEFRVFPNPTSGELNVEIYSEHPATIEFKIYNQLSSTVYEGKVLLSADQVNNSTLDLKHLPKGMYHIQIYELNTDSSFNRVLVIN